MVINLPPYDNYFDLDCNQVGANITLQPFSSQILVLNDSCLIINIDEQVYQKTNSMNVYPNPANYNITIEYLSKSKEVMISIYNLQGQLLLQQLLWQEKSVIDISKLAKGVYILELSDRGNTIVTKLVKE